MKRWLQLRAETHVPLVGVFTHGLGQTLVFATLPPLGREIGLQEFAIGVIVSASSFMFFLASRFWGRISDHMGRKPVMVIGLSGYAVGTLLFTLLFWLGMHAVLAGTTLWIAIIVARMLQSSVMSATGPATSAYIADITTTATRTAGMGRIAAAQNIGSIMGPALAGLLASISLLTPLLGAALLAGIAALITARYLPDHRPERRDDIVHKKMRFRDPRIVRVMMLSLVVFTGFSVVQQTLAFRIQDTLMLNATDTARLFGYTMVASAVCSLAAQFGLVQGMGLAPLQLLRIGIPAMLVSIASLVVADTLPGFTLAMGVLGFAMGLCGPGFNASASIAVESHEQGAVAGLSTSMPAMGFVAGPVLGTGLYQLMPTAPYAATSLLLLGASVYILRFGLLPADTRPE